MKKVYLIILSLLVIGTACKQNTKPKEKDDDTTETTAGGGEAKDGGGTLFTKAAEPEATAPFTIKLEEVTGAKTPALQSFVFGQQGNLWLMVGGRTNGFHGTSDKESTFPTKYSNTNFFVYDATSNTQWKLPIPNAYKWQLQSTNMQHHQDGNNLYCIGGYGSNCADDKPECYQTFPNLTIVSISEAIAAIKSGDAAALAAAIVTIEDERMQVTGGALRKIGDWFYLVMGQNYNTQYKGGVTGIYTEQVRKFKISNALAIVDYTAYNEPWDETPDENNQFHRRDLTVSEAIMADKSVGIGVYGGVFTKNGGAFPSPIYIHQNGTTTSFTLDNTFKQQLNLYECGHVPMYDPTTNTMYTILLGGITDAYYKDGALMPGNPLNALPFSKHATTIARQANGSTVEYPQQSPALPTFIGSDAEFIIDADIARYGSSKGIIDLSKLPATETTDILLGYMYGGILATAEQSSEFNPTYASNKIYRVYISR